MCHNSFDQFNPITVEFQRDLNLKHFYTFFVGQIQHLHTTLQNINLSCHQRGEVSAAFYLYLFHPRGSITRSNWLLGKRPVLGSPSNICVQPCESVVNHPLPCTFCIKLLKISAYDFGTVGMRRRFCPFVYEFLTTVTKGVVQGVHKGYEPIIFSVIRRHKVS